LSSVCAAARAWSGGTARGNARVAGSSSVAAKASVRTIDATRLVVTAFLAGRTVAIPEEERSAAVRRALFVYAAGGELTREPRLDDPAVFELASDLDTPRRRSELAAALASRPLDATVKALLHDPELAWRAFACALLAEALGEE
jgi:hypothetical protein